MIRKFTLNDSAEINTLGNKVTPKFSQLNNLEEIYKDNYTNILIYENEKRVLGFLMYTTVPESVDILYIIVDEPYRRLKIASCLMDYLITDLNEKIKYITLEVRKSNLPALNFYKKFGFSIINTRKEYYENQEDAYLMGREVNK